MRLSQWIVANCDGRETGLAWRVCWQCSVRVRLCTKHNKREENWCERIRIVSKHKFGTFNDFSEILSLPTHGKNNELQDGRTCKCNHIIVSALHLFCVYTVYVDIVFFFFNLIVNNCSTLFFIKLIDKRKANR